MFNNIISRPILRFSMVILVNENIFKLSPFLCKDISRRHFARWSTRKPSRVFMPDDISSGRIDSKEFYQSEYENSNSDERNMPKHHKERIKNESSEDSKNSSTKSWGYNILEEHDSIFSNLMTQVGNRKMRRKFDIMMLEGKRLNMDALQAGLKPSKLFFTKKSILEEMNIPLNTKIPLYKLPYKSVVLWSKLDTPPGIVGFYSIPKEKDIVTVDTLPIKVLCDNVRDPGNLGSIIRVAASVGCTQLLLTKGCTDPWDSKVLRSASGGHFHIPIKMDISWSDQDILKPSDQVFLADSHSVRTRSNLPLMPYHDVAFSKINAIVVVIGGETEGLSSEALTLGSRHEGSRLYIPLSNGMESLNSGCALSVILFEIKRQLCSTKSDKQEHLLDSDESLVVSLRSNS